jgi:hypothetical protein
MNLSLWSVAQCLPKESNRENMRQLADSDKLADFSVT